MMTNNIHLKSNQDLQIAYILHRKPYRETSYLLDLWVRDMGRVKCIAKGVRGGKKKTLMTLFQPIWVKLYGRGELKTLYTFEDHAMPIALYGNFLVSALYLNEILVRLLHLEDPHPELFDRYAQTLQHIKSCPDLLQPFLRQFEIALLEHLGYGLNLEAFIDIASTHLASGSASLYLFDPEQGWKNYFHSIDNNSSRYERDRYYVYDVQSLSAIAQRNWFEPGILRDAKRLMRQALVPLLGTRPLMTPSMIRSSSGRLARK